MPSAYHDRIIIISYLQCFTILGNPGRQGEDGDVGPRGSPGLDGEVGPSGLVGRVGAKGNFVMMTLGVINESKLM